VAHQLFQGVRRFRLTPLLWLAAYRLRIFAHLAQPIDRLPVRPGDQVPVGVHGDLDGMVPHLPLREERPVLIWALVTRSLAVFPDMK